jgi:beta-alanine--pyruvate transaminase
LFAGADQGKAVLDYIRLLFDRSVPPSEVAAIMIEPLQGEGGYLVPPPGFLAGLRELCDQHGILLIFDEVITGFGRTGSAFAAQQFGVTPDIITCAKGLTNGAVPMGAVLVSKKIHDAFMQGPAGIELFHGYTYSAHPIACAAGLAALRLYEDEGLLTRARSIAATFEQAVHSLRGLPHVIDIRNYGLVAGIELEPAATSGARAFDVYLECFERGLLIRTTGDTIALSPALVVEPTHLDELIGILGTALRKVA